MHTKNKTKTIEPRDSLKQERQVGPKQYYSMHISLFQI
jgi:hypothetical protein